MNFKYGGQYTPLYTASQNDRHEVVDVLLSTAGVDANMADSHDQSPLWRAAYTGNIKCVQHLLAARARGVEVDINYIDNYGDTAPSCYGGFKPSKLLLFSEQVGKGVRGGCAFTGGCRWCSNIIRIRTAAPPSTWRVRRTTSRWFACFSPPTPK